MEIFENEKKLLEPNACHLLYLKSGEEIHKDVR